MAREKMPGGTAIVAASCDNGHGADVAHISQNRVATTAKKVHISFFFFFFG